MNQCVMCESEIKTNQAVWLATDSLFANNRWTEHLNSDMFCSIECMSECLEVGEPYENGMPDENGADCSVCETKVSAGHTVSVGWHKTKSARWHKIITTKFYCTLNPCLHQDLENPESAINMEVPKKPRKATKKKKSKKKK